MRRIVLYGCFSSLLILAFLGMDFSPSFTALFYFGFLLLDVSSLAVETIGKGGENGAMPPALRLAGDLLTLPAAVIYAVGDDLFRFALLSGVGVSLVIHFAFVHSHLTRANRTLTALTRWEALLRLLSVLFTALCSINSTALRPAAMGLACLYLTHVRFASGTVRIVLTGAGYSLVTVFLVSPALFGGGV